MNFCPIVPTCLLDKIAERFHHHMCVAAFVDFQTKEGSAYWDFYKRMVARGDFVILDNGAYEERLVSDDQYVQMIRELRPAVYTVPDVVGDHIRSLAKAKEWKKRFVPMLNPCRPMYVFHGHPSVFELWWKTLGTPLDVAIPKRTRTYTRVQMAKHALNVGRAYGAHINIHAFGFVDENPLEEIRELERLGVSSIDSSEPVWKGLYHCDTGEEIKHNPKFKDHVHDPIFNLEERMEKVEFNLDQVMTACASDYKEPPNPLEGATFTFKGTEYTKAAKRDETRPRYDLLPAEWLRELALITQEGIERGYGENNWKSGDESFARDCLNHAQEHLARFNEGDRTENHLAKVAWNALAARWILNKIDSQAKSPKAEE